MGRLVERRIIYEARNNSEKYNIFAIFMFLILLCVSHCCPNCASRDLDDFIIMSGYYILRGFFYKNLDLIANSVMTWKFILDFYRILSFLKYLITHKWTLYEDWISTWATPQSCCPQLELCRILPDRHNCIGLYCMVYIWAINQHCSEAQWG